MNRQQDSSYLYDSKMELHPDENSFASPTFNVVSDKVKCSFGKVAKVILVIILVAAAFIGGYLVRRAVGKARCSVVKKNDASNGGDLKFLKEILNEMSPSNIEQTLRFV